MDRGLALPFAAALTETVMREALILAVGCCLIMVLAAGFHFVP